MYQNCILNTVDVQDTRKALNPLITECPLRVRHHAGNVEEQCKRSAELISTDQSFTVHLGKARGPKPAAKAQRGKGLLSDMKQGPSRSVQGEVISHW